MRFTPRVWMVILSLALAATVGAVAIFMVFRPGRSRSEPERAPAGPRHGPKAVADATEATLGKIERSEQFAHVFTVRNEGEAPLQLSRGGSSCKCTVASVPEDPVPPGGEAKIRVGANASVKDEPLKKGRISEQAWIRTNDPEHQKITFSLAATCIRRLAAAPEEISIQIHAGAPPEFGWLAEALVYSQVWAKFAVTSVKCSRPTIKCAVEPADEQWLVDNQARSGYRLAVRLPTDMPQGTIDERVDLVATPESGEKAVTLAVPIRGQFAGLIRISGPKVDTEGTLHLGTLREGQSIHEGAVLKVNCDRRVLGVKRVEANPAFLRGRLVPLRSGTEQVGLYRIEIEASGVPPCNFTGKTPAVVCFKTDNPQLPNIELKVDLAVLPQDAPH
jgi:hypothetical protein